MINICGVYTIRSVVKPERVYIGSSNDINRRWRGHRHLLKNNKHSSVKLQNHYKKYGKKDLVFEMVEEFEFFSKEHLLEREQHYMDNLNPWFNINKIAGSTLGYKHTDETKLIISKCSKNQKPRKHTEETKRKISENSGVKGKPAWNRGMSPSPETREKHRKKMLKYKPTQETKDKISATLKGVPKSKESIEKKKKTMEGWRFPEESKSKVSESLKRFFAEHPEAREHLSKIQTGKKRGPNKKKI